MRYQTNPHGPRSQTKLKPTHFEPIKLINILSKVGKSPKFHAKTVSLEKIEVAQKRKSDGKNESVIYLQVSIFYSCFLVAIQTFFILPNTQKPNKLTGYFRKDESRLETNFDAVSF